MIQRLPTKKHLHQVRPYDIMNVCDAKKSLFLPALAGLTDSAL